MAHWRERGFVPDSEGEEDDFQNSASSPQHEAENGSTDVGDKSYTSNSDGTNKQAIHDSASKDLESRLGITADKLNRTLSQGLRTIRDVLATSDDNTINTVLRTDDDESSLSSLPSSIGNSPLLQPLPDALLQQITSDDPGHTRDITSASRPLFGRNLRLRNPIQLHPYMLEDAQYRTLMRARGLKPVNLPRQIVQPEADLPEPEENQSLNTHDVSQASAEAIFGQASSPPDRADDNDSESQSPLRGHRRLSPSDVFEVEDELPELSHIFKKPGSSHSKQYNARRKTADDTRRTKLESNFHPSPLDLAVDRLVNAENSAINNHGFTLPPSPPRSSSPGVQPDIMMQGMQEASPYYPKTPAALPTPLISSDNGTRKRSNFEFSSSSSSLSSSSTTISSEDSGVDDKQDDSQRIQVMTRKIRGVLPASWLKLDMSRAPKHPKQRNIHHSPHKLADDRGVARRVSKTKGKSMLAGKTMEAARFDFVDDESDDSSKRDTQHGNLDLEFSAANNADTYFGEAEEDNEIDYMLPTQTRKRQSQPSARKRQQKIDKGWAVSTSRPAKPSQSGLPHHQYETHRTVASHKQIKQRKRRKVQQSSTHMDVLDAPMLRNLQRSSQPQFLKVAARSAKSKSSRPYTAPAKKFFQFPTTADTQELTEVIRSWTSSSHKSDLAPSILKNADMHAENGILSFNSSEDLTANHDEADTTPNLSFLKHSTDALLRRVSRVDRNVNLHQPGPTQATQKRSNILEDNFQKSSTSSTFLLPHRNRSGLGQFISRSNLSRPAQLEARHRVPLLTQARIDQRIPRRLQENGHRHSSLQEQMSPTLYPMGASKGNHPGIRPTPTDNPRSKTKLSRKQKPRHIRQSPTIETTQVYPINQKMDENFAEDSTPSLKVDGLSETKLSQQLHIAAGHMRHTLCYDGITTSERGFFVQRALDQVIARANDTLVYDQTSRQSTTAIRILSTQGRSESVGPYDPQAIFVICECQKSILDNIQSWNYRSLSANEAIEDLINMTESSLCFPQTKIKDLPPNTLSLSQKSLISGSVRGERFMGREHYIHASIAFIQSAITTITHCVTEASAMRYPAALKTMTRLAIYSVQLCILADGRHSLQQLASETCISVVQKMLSIGLNWTNLKSRVLMSAENFDRHCSEGANPTVADSSEVEAFTVSWQACSMMGLHSTRADFTSLLCNALDVPNGRSPVMELSIRLMSVHYALNCTPHYLYDRRNIDVNDSKDRESGWHIFIPSMQKTISCVRSLSKENINVAFRQYFHIVLCFCAHFVKVHQWRASPSLVKILLEAYSFNEMIPYETKEDVDSIFYDLQIIDSVSEQQRNDFYDFIDLVKEAINEQRLLSQNDFDHRNSTKELRGLIYSLIPNNAQQYDAREALLADQFLGLKNHFTLYIALYKSSPEGFGPRIQQLEQQVDLEYSHLMVCRLALQVWESIAMFEVKRSSASSRAHKDIGMWLNSILNQLSKRNETGQQDASTLYREAMHKLRLCFDTSSTETMLEYLSPILENTRLALPPVSQFGDRTAQATLDALRSCSVNIAPDDNGRKAVNIILPVVKHAFQAVLRMQRPSSELLRVATSCWFAVALSMVKVNGGMWHEYIEPRSPMSIDQLGVIEGGPVCDMAKCIFVSSLLESERDDIFLEHRPQIFTIWVSSLLSPLVGDESVYELTQNIIQHGGESLQLDSLKNIVRSNVVSTKDIRFRMIQHTIQNIHAQQDDPESEWLAGGLEEHDLRQLLKVMTDTMKRSWKALQADPVRQNAYTALTQAIVNEMEIYTFQGFKLDHWFSDGKEFPRASQTFDNIFKCQYGSEENEVSKSSIVTFRMKSIEAFAFKKQDDLATELARVFCCTDSLRVRVSRANILEYSVDLVKQTRFLQIVSPGYIGGAHTLKGAVVALPLLRCLCELTSKIFFRIDNAERTRMEKFVNMSIICLRAVSQVLRKGMSTPASAILLEYARTGVHMVWQLLAEIEASEDTKELFVTSIFSIVETVCSWLSGSNVDGMRLLAQQFFHFCSLEAKEIEVNATMRGLSEFVMSDLQEGLQKMPEIKAIDYFVDTEDIENQARAFLALVQSLPLLSDDDYDVMD